MPSCCCCALEQEEKRGSVVTRPAELCGLSNKPGGRGSIVSCWLGLACLLVIQHFVWHGEIKVGRGCERGFVIHAVLQAAQTPDTSCLKDLVCEKNQGRLSTAGWHVIRLGQQKTHHDNIQEEASKRKRKICKLVKQKVTFSSS